MIVPNTKEVNPLEQTSQTEKKEQRKWVLWLLLLAVLAGGIGYYFYPSKEAVPLISADLA